MTPTSGDSDAKLRDQLSNVLGAYDIEVLDHIMQLIASDKAAAVEAAVLGTLRALDFYRRWGRASQLPDEIRRRIDVLSAGSNKGGQS